MGMLFLRADIDRDKDVRRRKITLGLESGITGFIVRDTDADLCKLGRFGSIVTHDGMFDAAYESVTIRDKGDQDRAMSLAGRKNVIIRADDWKVIPIENIIASFTGTTTKLFAIADRPADAKLLLSVMEKGVDGVIFESDDPSLMREYAEAVSQNGKERLSEITIASVLPIEPGDRVCVDTCVSMGPGEGMLVGSYSGCLFLVQSESEGSEYSASRPFRVNAGSLHSYIQAPNGRTRYLSELSGGDAVLICDSEGNTRTAAVGRCKTERRPLLMVYGTHGRKECSVVLQNAETVRLVTRDGSIPVTELRDGDTVLAKLSEGGRHFGMPVDETVSER